MKADLHRHLWTEPLLAALAQRRTPPRVVLEGDRALLYCVGEHPYAIDLAQAADRRTLLDDGLDVAVVALSSPIGIEALPRREATDLIETHLAGVRAVGHPFAGWGPVPVEDPDADDVDRALDQGCVGISLPSGALATPQRLSIVAPILRRTAEREVPLFVHPGPAPGEPAPQTTALEPEWWIPLTRYVSQMQAAWLTWVGFGRRAHPDLAVVFALLAGGAPLMSERLEARGGPAIDLRDPSTFYDTSSFGRRAVDAMADLVGLSRLVYGSDHPIIEPISTGRDAALQENAARLLRSSSPLGRARQHAPSQPPTPPGPLPPLGRDALARSPA